MPSRGRDTSELLLAVYDREDTAEHVFGVLRAQGDVLTASLDSAAIVRVASDRGFTIIRTEPPQPSGSFWGVFWEALFGLIFRVASPAPAPADNSNLGQLFTKMERAGLDERFRARARRALQRGSSALALFALNWNTESLLNQLYLRPHALVRASLSPQQHLELLRELGGLPPDDASDG
jgi:uncharacterized membrane protein